MLDTKKLPKASDVRSPFEIGDVCSLIIRLSITSSLKPTNTAFAWMRTTKLCCEVTKELFERNVEVHNSFILRLEDIQIASEIHKNTIFFAWMANFLKDKVTLGEQTLENLSILERYQKILLNYFRQACDSGFMDGPCSNNNCKKVIEDSFIKPITESERISFAEFLPLFQCAIYSASHTQEEENVQISKSLLYEILLRIINKTESAHAFILLNRIGEKIDQYAENLKDINGSKLEKVVCQLAGLIEEAGNGLINQKSNCELKTAYFKLIKKLLERFHWNNGKDTSFSLLNNNEKLRNIAIKFFQFLPQELANIPECAFKLNLELWEESQPYSHIFEIRRPDVQGILLLKITNLELEKKLSVNRALQLLDCLLNDRNLFLMNTKDCLKAVEITISKIQAPIERARAVGELEAFSEKIKLFFPRASVSNYELVMNGFLQHMKMQYGKQL